MNRFTNVITLATSFVLVSGTAPAAEPVRRAAESTGPAFVLPLLGYVFDAGLGQIRSMVGTPGAGRVLASVNSYEKLDRALVSPAAGIALANAPGAEAVLLITGLDSQPAAKPVTGATRSFDAAAFSPSGKAAVLYGSECNCLQVVSGFPDSPAVSRVVDAGTLAGKIAAVAINDEASFAAAALTMADDSSEAREVVLFDLRAGDGPQSIPGAAASALAFSPSGRNLAIVELNRRSASLVRDVGGARELVGLAGEREGLSEPRGILFAAEDTLLIADRAGYVHGIDLTSGRTRSMACTCKPEVVEAMTLQSAYRLTGTEGGAVWMLDLNNPEGRFVFIPIDSDELQAEGRTGSVAGRDE